MRKKTNSKKVLSLLLSFVLITAMALTLSFCGKNDNAEPASTADSSAADTAGTVRVGEGKHTFELFISFDEQQCTHYTVSTDRDTVGSALTELGLIEGEKGEFGMFIKKAGGVTADYSVDGTYWAFYIGDEYAVSGVDTTPITDGAVYRLSKEK